MVKFKMILRTNWFIYILCVNYDNEVVLLMINKMNLKKKNPKKNFDFNLTNKTDLKKKLFFIEKTLKRGNDIHQIYNYRTPYT